MAKCCRRLIAYTVPLLVAVTIAIGCGDGGSGSRAESTAPRPDNPAFGSAGHALISDRLTSVDESVDTIWVGFERPGWDTLVRLHATLPPGHLPWVVGRIAADPDRPLSFYFEPGTTSAGEVVAEGIQTSLDAIKRNPDVFAAEQPFGHWAVAATIEELRPGTP